METTFSDDFKKRFLLTFTKELILHSKKREIIALQNIITSQEETKRREISQFNKEITVSETSIPIRKTSEPQRQIQQLIVENPEKRISVVPLRPMTHPIPEAVKEEQSVQKPAPVPQAPAPKMARLRIPETPLPPHLAYVRPTLTENKTKTDWEKLNPLIQDNAIRTIEVNPDQKIIVSGSMGERTTNIILNSEEINEIINKFAYVSKIPVSEGVYKVVVENLIFFAVISNVVGSRFIIQKIQPQPENIYPQYRRY
jgi:hypothetical protein